MLQFSFDFKLVFVLSSLYEQNESDGIEGYLMQPYSTPHVGACCHVKSVSTLIAMAVAVKGQIIFHCCEFDVYDLCACFNECVQKTDNDRRKRVYKKSS